MLAKINTAATQGLEAVIIDVEVDVASRGLPGLTIVGLPDKAVEEARDRVKTAVINSSVDFPAKKITINLAPADIHKEGSGYDLPIAVGILIATGEFDAKIDDCLFIGELSLDGKVRRVNGILPIVLAAKKCGFKKIFLPTENAQEAAIIKGIHCMPVASLAALVAHLTGVIPILESKPIEFVLLETQYDAECDFANISGQEQAKRALEIAAAGGHHVFLNGSPGAGKTMLARAFPSILPSLTEREAIEVTKIYSIAGSLSGEKSLITTRPFRSPHHTISRSGMIGGGTNPRPGEISLAHHGVLFLDEFPEFPRSIIESLRQPMEEGMVHIARAKGSMSYPARFSLLAAANPCPCGYFLSKRKQCTCLPGSISRYQKKISGPILDRIDLHLTVSEVEIEKLKSHNASQVENSASIRNRVEKARLVQSSRYKNEKISCNSELSTRKVREYAHLSQPAETLLLEAAGKLGLTARSFFKVIKISRTIADLAQSETIEIQHVAESLQFRPAMGI